MEELKLTIFKFLCRADCTLEWRANSLVSAPYLSGVLKTPVSEIRKALKLLKAEGLVASGFDSWFDSYLEQQVVSRGFTVTLEAQETDIYKAEKRRESEFISNCFGLDAD